MKSTSIPPRCSTMHLDGPNSRFSTDFQWNSVDFRLIFSGFPRIFHDFQWISTDFSMISDRIRRFSMDFHCLSTDFPLLFNGFSMFLNGFHRFSMIFHGFQAQAFSMDFKIFSRIPNELHVFLTNVVSACNKISRCGQCCLQRT